MKANTPHTRWKHCLSPLNMLLAVHFSYKYFMKYRKSFYYYLLSVLIMRTRLEVEQSVHELACLIDVGK